MDPRGGWDLGRCADSAQGIRGRAQRRALGPRRRGRAGPQRRLVTTASGARIGYDVLILCPGLELAWDLVPGLTEAMATPFAASNYAVELAPKNAELVRRFRGGQALFAAPGSPIKCPGAPQKATYLACDYWQRGRQAHQHAGDLRDGRRGHLRCARIRTGAGRRCRAFRNTDPLRK